MAIGPAAPWAGLAASRPEGSSRTEGARVIDIVAPGFAVDCLETLEEVNMGIREKLEALGCELRYIPCLNDSDAHARALSAWVAANA